MGDLWDFQIDNRLSNSGLMSGILMAINEEIYAGRDGADCIKDSLKSLVKPYGLPLIGVGIIFFTSKAIVSWVSNKISGWRWYFKAPLKIMAGLGGFLIFLGGLELLTNDEYTEDEENYLRKKRIDERNKRVAMEKLPEPSNTVESDGAGGLRRRIDEFKLHKINSYSPWNSQDKEAVYITDRENNSNNWHDRKTHITKPFVRYNRRKPHWGKVQRGIEGPFRQNRRL